MANVPEELDELTYMIEHNPNCPMPFLVRLPGKAGRIDRKAADETEDILGYGKTLEIAAHAALLARQIGKEPDADTGRPVTGTASAYGVGA